MTHFSSSSKLNLILPLALFGVFGTSTPAQAALETRAGGALVYDTDSNLTWTADANLLATLQASQGYNSVINAIIAASPIVDDTPNVNDNYPGGNHWTGQYALSSNDFGPSGGVNWFGAKAFVTYLNSIQYQGANGWRLPETYAGTVPGAASDNSEIGHLYYHEIGGLSGNQAGLPDSAYFVNDGVTATYWSGTEGPFPEYAWFFGMVPPGGGSQSYNDKDGLMFRAWAVRDGDVAAVPLPAAAWLFGSGLVGLIGLKRRQA